MQIRDRQDAIIRSLRREGSSTIEQIAQSVDASRSTILRDISALRDQGFVIHSEPGRGGGVYLDPQSVQTTARLTVPEIFALVISVASIRAAANLPFFELADAGLAKIEKSLPSDKVRDLRRFMDCLWIGPLAPQVDTSNIGSVDSSLLTAFETAFLKRHLLQFQYCDAKNNVTERRVEPQALLILPPLWYLVAWDPKRSDFRHFRMDRITKPECLSDRKFQRRHVSFDEGVKKVRYA
ncbi:MAG: WYL domain-containing protein [Cognatishimia sp.]|uniref:helix-turn-helix transcriptional regulator n=1 Tax=Cognatishimia sp. TaxID=2211648 RepID=UPI003B8E0ACF